MSSRFVSIQVRIFLAFGIAIALLLAGGGWAVSRAFARTQRRQIEAQQAALVELLVGAMDDKVTTYRETLEAAARAEPGPRPGQDLARWIRSKSSLRSVFAGGILVADSRGRTLAADLPISGSVEARADLLPLLRKAAGDPRTTLAQVGRSGPGEAATLAMITPLPGSGGPPRQFLVGSINLAHDDFLGSLSRTRLPGGGDLMLRDERGRVLLQAPGAPPKFPELGGLVTERRLGTLPWSLSARTPAGVLEAPLARLRHALQAASALSVVFGLALTWLLSHRLTENLEAFTRQVEGAADRPAGKRAIPGKAHDETRILVEAFNALVGRLDARTAELLQAQERSGEELALAKHVLHRLVEPGLSALPPSFHMETLRTERISGDACTYRQGPPGLHFGLLCDATGHGLTAGISTLPAVQAFLSMAARDLPLETIYLEINQRIHQLMPVGRFLCLLLIRLDLRNGALSLLNAGLPDALLSIPGEGLRRFPSLNLPAGILAGVEPPEVRTVAAPPGSRLLAFTDGVQDLFPGTESERRLLQGLEACPLEVHRDAVQETLALAIRNQEQHDDVSWALWEVPPPVPLPEVGADRPDPVRVDLDGPLVLSVAFAPQHHPVRDVVPEVVRLLSSRGLEGPLAQVLTLALSEALTNAVDHGILRLDPALKRHGFEAFEALRRLHLAALQEGTVRLEIQVRTWPSGPVEELVVTVEDSGPGFDWRAWESSGPDEGGSAPGRGLRLLRVLAPDLAFNASGNRIRFTLREPPGTPGSGG